MRFDETDLEVFGKPVFEICHVRLFLMKTAAVSCLENKGQRNLRKSMSTMPNYFLWINHVTPPCLISVQSRLISAVHTSHFKRRSISHRQQILNFTQIIQVRLLGLYGCSYNAAKANLRPSKKWADYGVKLATGSWHSNRKMAQRDLFGCEFFRGWRAPWKHSLCLWKLWVNSGASWGIWRRNGESERNRHSRHQNGLKKEWINHQSTASQC